MKILFICSMAKLRSKTAGEIFASDSVQTTYAGTDSDADFKLTKDMIINADVIVCMENSHRKKARRMVKGMSQKMYTWHIPDDYDYMDPYLVFIMKGKYDSLLNTITKRSMEKYNE